MSRRQEAFACADVPGAPAAEQVQGARTLRSSSAKQQATGSRRGSGYVQQVGTLAVLVASALILALTILAHTHEKPCYVCWGTGDAYSFLFPAVCIIHGYLVVGSLHTR